MKIENDKEFSVTQNQIIKLEAALYALNKDVLPEWLRKAQSEAIRGVIDDLISQANEYIKTHNLPTRCTRCGKDDWDLADGCKKPAIFSPCVGDWMCQYKGEDLKNG